MVMALERAADDAVLADILRMAPHVAQDKVNFAVTSLFVYQPTVHRLTLPTRSLVEQ